MFYLDVIFKANSSVKPLNANTDKMIFAVSMENQTFIRYVAADGTSMILQSFDYKANFVNASLSFDFRLLHLTELIHEKGNKYYSSVIYDVQNPAIKSRPIHSSEIIKGDIEGIEKYTIIYLIRGKLSQHQIIIQSNNIILSKNLINTKLKHIIWSHYSPSNDILYVLAKSGEKILYYCNFINSDAFYTVKNIDEQFCDQKIIYSSSYHGNFCLLQQHFIEDSNYDQIKVHFFPKDKDFAIDIPKTPSNAPMKCFQYYYVIFVFVPNYYICIIDMKSVDYIVFDNHLAKIPVSSMITVYDEGMLCDNKEGIVYSTRINIDCFRDLHSEKEIKAVSIIGARINCSNYIYIPPKPKSASTEIKKQLSNEESKNSSKDYNEQDQKTESFSEFLCSSNFAFDQQDPLNAKRYSSSEEDILKIGSLKNLFRGVSDDDLNDSDEDNNDINQKKSGFLMDYGNTQKNVIFKKSFSFDINMHKENYDFLDSSSIEYQMIYGKIVVDKIIVLHIFDFLTLPNQISVFIKEFIKLNGNGCFDLPIPALAIYCKKPYASPSRLSLEIKKELNQIDKIFPTTGLVNRFDLFTRYLKKLMDERSSLSLSEACKKSMEVIRKQISLMLNLTESFMMWHAKGMFFKYRKFLISFCLYSELSFLNLPQIIKIRKTIIKYSKQYFTKPIREMMMIFGIYGTQSPDFTNNDCDYWKRRISLQSLCSNVQSKQASGKKQKEKPLINTFTVPYFKIRNQKVFHVHYYSHIP